MAKKKPVMTIPYPVYTMEGVERLLTASKALDLDSCEMIDKALDAFLKSKGL